MWLDEINQRSIGCAQRGDAAFALAHAFLPFGTQQCLRALQGALRIIHPERHRADRHAMQLEMLGGGAVQFAVQHEVDAALAEQVHRLGAMPADVVQAEIA